jgi:hypothetical protein
MRTPLQLTFLAQLGNGAVLYGLEYPGLYGCCSWCYLTIAKNVIIATQPEKDCGTSLTNIWCEEFIEVVSDLPPIKAAGEGTTLRRTRLFAIGLPMAILGVGGDAPNIWSLCRPPGVGPCLVVH